MSNLYPTFDRFVARAAKEERLAQRGLVVWLYGLSGSGKSTIAASLDHRLHAMGRLTAVLDGDNIRTGLNRNLGFSDEDRAENIRRIAEVAKLMAGTGLITLVSFITPKQALRDSAREIIGRADLLSVYVQASFETCAARDPKGLYAKVAAGQVKQFTGKDSGFEAPNADQVDLILDTEAKSVSQCVAELEARIAARQAGG